MWLTSLVSIVLTANRVTVVDGKEVLGPAEQAHPGDVIEYRAEYKNAGTQPVQQLAATLPIPRGTEYLSKTALPQQLFASLDGRNFAPAPLHVPESVALKNVNLALELEALSFALASR